MKGQRVDPGRASRSGAARRASRSGAAASGSAVRALVVVLAIGTLLVLALLAAVRRPARPARGGEILWDDFGFRVIASEALERIDAPGGPLEPRGVYRAVRIGVANHAKRVDFLVEDPHYLLKASSFERWPPDARATAAWRAARGYAGPPERLAAGEGCELDLVWDVPRDAQGLAVDVSWGGPLVDAIDLLVFGERVLPIE